MMKPEISTIPEFYQGYVQSLPENSLSELLQHTLDRFDQLLAGLDEKQGDLKYEENKWTIKQVIQHLIDGERIFNYRSLRFSRGDQTDLPGFDQDAYVEILDGSNRKLSDLVTEFNNVRKSTQDFYESLSEEELARTGTANGYPFSVNSIGYITVGHLNHHLNIIEDRYLVIND